MTARMQDPALKALLVFALTGLLGCTAALDRTNAAPAVTSAQQARIEAMAGAYQQRALSGPFVSALDPTRAPGAAEQTVLFDPSDDYYGLPADGGTEDLVMAYCAACHSLRIVMQQRASADRWDELLTWMVEKQNMPELDPADRAQILDYLSTYFP